MRSTPLVVLIISSLGNVALDFSYWGIIWAEPVAWICMVIPLILWTVKILRGTKLSEE